MKERPILFNTDMVKAIIDGRKTQTRRPITPQPRLDEKAGFNWKGYAHGLGFTKEETAKNFIKSAFPLGKVGDRLWVRETFQGPLFDSGLAEDYQENPDNYKIPEYCYYKASDPRQEFYTPDDELTDRWKPSIHMPRWACRLVLEITNVRLERIQDITEEDALNEGADSLDDFQNIWKGVYLNSWERNEWVWVIEFKITELNSKKQERAA